MKKDIKLSTKNYCVDGKYMTRREFWFYLVDKKQIKHRDEMPEKYQKEYTGQLDIYRTKAGYIYAVV